MRKTTNGRRIKHILSEKVAGYIVKATSPKLNIGKYFEAGENPIIALKEAEDFQRMATHPITKENVETMIITKTIKSSRPHRNY